MQPRPRTKLESGHNALNKDALRGFLKSMITSAIRDKNDTWRQCLGVNNLMSACERGLLSA